MPENNVRDDEKVINVKKIRETQGGEGMALEVIKAAAYHNDISSIAKSKDISGKKLMLRLIL